MFKILLEKELKAIFLSPKFVATFAVCSLLLILSVVVGIQEYKASVSQYETAVRLVEQGIMQETTWWGIDNAAYRAPDPMQVFVSGVNNDVGRLSNISTWEEVKLEQSSYADDTLFAVFRFIDFAFIVQVVLSLFAILFTYDTINGERESGTLKLAFSNAVPRGEYVLAKFLGSWLGLTIPLMIPILLAILLVMVSGVPLETIHWQKVGTLIGASVLYFTFFVALGLFVSAFTKRSSVSFLILLVAWIGLVLIVPRAATMAAGQMVDVPSVAEVESQRDRFSTDRRTQFFREREELRADRNATMANMSPEQREQYRNANQAQWQQAESDMRQSMDEEIAEFTRQLNESLRNAKANQERLAFTLSRFSPASSYQLASMNIAGTNTELKRRYEDSMKAYRMEFTQFVESKRDEERRRNRQRGRRMFSSNDQETLDTSELPRYQAPEYTFAEAVAPSVADVGLLGLYSILAFAGAFVVFLRYDVR